MELATAVVSLDIGHSCPIVAGLAGLLSYEILQLTV